jgi:hypothetical protein
MVIEEETMPGDIHIISERIDPGLLARLVRGTFVTMVKYVVDLDREVVAIGGELHADAEAVLLEAGSDSKDLWGANYHPGYGKAECIEFTAMINVRPSRGNPAMEVQDPAVRERIRSLTFRLIGEGEPLA